MSSYEPFSSTQRLSPLPKPLASHHDNAVPSVHDVIAAAEGSNQHGDSDMLSELPDSPLLSRDAQMHDDADAGDSAADNASAADTGAKKKGSKLHWLLMVNELRLLKSIGRDKLIEANAFSTNRNVRSKYFDDIATELNEVYQGDRRVSLRQHNQRNVRDHFELLMDAFKETGLNKASKERGYNASTCEYTQHLDELLPLFSLQSFSCSSASVTIMSTDCL
jgi:hypothetical protein